MSLNVHDKLIGSVPSQIVNVARSQLTDYEGRVAEYNVAIWLQLPGLANLPVSLQVSYHDGGRQREVSVDHGNINAQGKILLSGIARMPFKHRIEDMQVRLRSAVPVTALVVEEFFVQAVELSSSESRQALA